MSDPPLVARSHAGVDRNSCPAQSRSASRRSPAHTRAWIETVEFSPSTGETLSPAHTRAWIETFCGSVMRADQTSPAHTRAWIETWQRGTVPRVFRVARSHAGVDRNASNPEFGANPQVSPAHTRAWIETTRATPPMRLPASRPLTRGRGSKQRLRRTDRRP